MRYSSPPAIPAQSTYHRVQWTEPTSRSFTVPSPMPLADTTGHQTVGVRWVFGDAPANLMRGLVSDSACTPAYLRNSSRAPSSGADVLSLVISTILMETIPVAARTDHLKTHTRDRSTLERRGIESPSPICSELTGIRSTPCRR